MSLSQKAIVSWCEKGCFQGEPVSLFMQKPQMTPDK